MKPKLVAPFQELGLQAIHRSLLVGSLDVIDIQMARQGFCTTDILFAILVTVALPMAENSINDCYEVLFRETDNQDISLK